jgi:hypothetical protein
MRGWVFAAAAADDDEGMLMRCWLRMRIEMEM